jgi:hypothetical protein
MNDATLVPPGCVVQTSFDQGFGFFAFDGVAVHFEPLQFIRTHAVATPSNPPLQRMSGPMELRARPMTPTGVVVSGITGYEP